MDALATTLGTFDAAFSVFNKGKDDFEWFLAIFAVELIARHTDLAPAST